MATPTPEAQPDIATPRTVTGQAAGSVATPSNVPSVAAGSVAVPRVLTTQPQPPIPKVGAA